MCGYYSVFFNFYYEKIEKNTIKYIKKLEYIHVKGVI